ncbi:hypothetical protein [Bradyrhizobium macuxiense]|uniref:hypothetical protein n=1 Tax=Bradyrhizobium macuxiense TaxID=1755647 RepID=UPI0013659D7C|nr:hypothetical protein [Bradyrhizobium macuxiense]
MDLITVIASKAEQSIAPRALKYGLLRFARNDEVKLPIQLSNSLFAVITRECECG